MGLGEEENFIASDITAILKYTRNVYFLENDEYVHIVRDEVTILDGNRNVVEKEIKEINWGVEAATKGGYNYFMLKEIYEQSKRVKENLLRILNANVEIQLDDIKITNEDLDSKSSHCNALIKTFRGAKNVEVCATKIKRER